jgi:hypothetical protein
MPWLDTAFAHTSQMFGDPEFLVNNRGALLALFAPGNDMADTTQRMLSAESPLQRAMKGADPNDARIVAGALPRLLMEVSRAVVYDNLQRESPVGITFSWQPAYEHSVTVWESPPTSISPGWINVVFKGRYPGDPHPIGPVAS